MKKQLGYEEQSKQNAIKANEIISDYLNGSPVKDMKIRVASNAVTQYNRLLATKSAFATLGFSIARSVAKSREELKGMIDKPKMIE